MQTIFEDGNYKEIVWKIKNCIGCSSKSIVYSLTHDDENVVAAKVIDKLNRQSQRYVAKEKQLLQKLNHPNILRFVGYFETNKDHVLLTELCDGDLSDRRFTESEVSFWLRQLISALLFLHANNIVHRDIKGANLFYKGDILKLGDFGLACDVLFKDELLKQKCGTPHYIAPEILSGEGYSFPCDVWSFGVTMYTMLTKKESFRQNHSFLSTEFEEVVANSTNGTYKIEDLESMSDDAKDLISKILVVDPNKRATLNDIQTHPFFNEPV